MRLASGSDPVNYTMWRCTHCTGYPFTWKGPADPVFVDWFQKRYNFETLQSPKWMFLWLSCFWHMMILNEMLNAGWEKLLLISNLSQFRFFFQHDIWEKLLYPKIREFLHKHRKAETWWTPWDPATIPCCCARLQTHSLCPDDSSDHLAVNLEDLSLPPDPCLFSDVNANSTYYWSKTPYLQLATNRFRTWLKQDILEQHFWQPIRHFLTQEWKQHLDYVDHYPRLTFHAVQRLLRWLPYDCVLHHGDHEQYRITVFCPRLYFQGALNNVHMALINPPTIKYANSREKLITPPVIKYANLFSRFFSVFSL